MTGRIVLLIGCLTGLMFFTGCSSTGKTVTLNVQAAQPAAAASAKKADTLTVTVTDFEDVRPDKSRIGVRRHLWGGETTFNVPGGKPGEVVSKILADYFKRRGWPISGNPDVTFSGKVLDFSADADSKIFNTEISVRTKVVVQALNSADGSIVRMTLSGDGSQRVFWFDPEDVQGLVSEVLTASLDKLMESTRVEGQTLRLR